MEELFLAQVEGGTPWLPPWRKKCSAVGLCLGGKKREGARRIGVMMALLTKGDEQTQI